MARLCGVSALLLLAAWGVALGAWVATAATLGCAALLASGSRRRWLQLGLAATIVLAGTPEVLWSVHTIGARARAGDLGTRDKVAVYGFNLVFGSAAHLAGFSHFGRETIALGIPWSFAGRCPDQRLARYGKHLPRAFEGHHPRLRRWRSQMPMRSPKVRAPIRAWADRLPDPAPGSTHALAPTRLPPWSSTSYTSTDESNQVPVALSTPTTTLSGQAVAIDGRWRLDLTVDLALAYPERSTLDVGWFALEEGMFHDARPLLQPYCLEYSWSTWADDPVLSHGEAIRGPFERLSTWVLRRLGAAYR